MKIMRISHSGNPNLDYATPVKTLARACFDGWVDGIDLNPQGYGLPVVLRHDCSLSLYAHPVTVPLQVDQWVTRNQILALTGGAASDPNAGNSTGPHLHFEIRPFLCGLPGYGGAIDPQPLIEEVRNAQKALVLSAYLNIRKGPSVNTPVVGSVKHGTIVTVLNTEMGWIQIDSPRKGWINKNFVQLLK